MVLTSFQVETFSGFVVSCNPENSVENWNDLTDGYVGIRLSTDDGFHYGWLHFTRPNKDLTTPFMMVGMDWHPVPGAPIEAGLPPSPPPLQTTLSAEGFTLTWDNRFPGLQLEWTETLTEPLNWQPVATPNPGTVTLPVTGTNRFYRLRKP